MKTLKITGLLLAMVLVMTVPAGAHGRMGRRIVTIPYFGAWNWYYPSFGWYGLYGPYPYYREMPKLGELKLKTNVKDAKVYINGAYAGKAEKLKKIRLRPDSYTLEVRAPGYKAFSERVYVVAGKTLEVEAQLTSAPQSPNSHG
jgi:hypothetical protein